jgi:hypothetical protein
MPLTSICGIHEKSCLSVKGGHTCRIVDVATRSNGRETLHRVTRSVMRRARMCIEAKGEHFEHLLQQ